MKKNFLKITLAVMTMIGFTSCLGDSVSSRSGTGFTYVTTDEYGVEKLAMVLANGEYYPIKSSVLENSDLRSGDCAVVNFKVTSDQYAGNVYHTSDFDIVTSYTEREHIYIKEEKAPVNLTDTLNVFSSISALTNASNDLIKDKWYIGYSSEFQKDQGAKATFYYDETNQPELVDKNIFVDVRIVKDAAKPEERYTVGQKTLVADFKLLRNIIFKGIQSDEVIYKIYFRYNTKETVSGVATVKEKSTLVSYFTNPKKQ